MSTVSFTRCGSGRPMVLVHGIGSSRQVWDAVVPLLAGSFEVITVDLPGFGRSAPFPPEVEPSPAALAAAVAELLDELGIEEPHIVGNSLGGWICLELAQLRPVASVTLLSPAGMWWGDTPLYNRVSLAATRWLATRGRPVVDRMMKYRLGRLIVLGQTHGRPMRMSVDVARQSVAAMAECPGFDATFKATLHRQYLDRTPFTAPVTVAFGSRDLLMRGRSRRLEQLPAGSVVTSLPGCGHVPMNDDPAAVASLIRTGARTAGLRSVR